MKHDEINTPLSKDHSRAIVRAGAVAAFLASLAVYIKTMAASASFWDSGEFVAAAHILGVPHSPGTPLYVIVARLFDILPIPGLSVAERVSLLSAVCGATGVLFVYLIVVRIFAPAPGRPASRAGAFARMAGALAGALFLAFSDTYWNNAIEAEVYAMSTALMGLMTWLALKWGANPRGAKSTHYVYLLFYLLALSVGFHLGTVLVFSGIFLFVLTAKDKPFTNFEFLVACLGVGIFVADATLYRNGQLTVGLLVVFAALLIYVTRTRSRFALACTALFVVGLSVHFYLMIRSGLNPSIDEGDPASWRSLYAVLRREQYPPSNVFARKAAFSFQLEQFAGYFQAQYQMAAAYVGKFNVAAVVPIGLGVWGIVDHFARDRRAFAMLAVTLLVTSLGLVVFLNFSDSEVRERDYFYSPAFYYFAVYIGIGAVSVLGEVRAFLARKYLRLATAAYALGGALAVAPVFTLNTHYFRHDRSRNTVCREFGRNMLAGLDRDAILFTYGDNDTFPIWYVQEVEGVRRDVRVVNLSLANTPWYIKQCRDNEPRVPVTWTDEQIDRLRPVVVKDGWLMVRDLMVQHVLQNNHFTRPVYFAVTIEPKVYAPYRKYLEYQGLAYRVVPRQGDNMIDVERLERNLTQECRFDSILTGDLKRDYSVYLAPYTENIIQNYAAAFAQLAYEQHQQSRFADAARSMSVAHEISPRVAPPRRFLGLYYFDAGDTTRATEFYEDEIAANPDHVEAMYTLAGIYERIGEDARALDVLDRAIGVAPDDRDLVLSAFGLARTHGMPDRAERYAAAWLRRNPGDAEMRSALDRLLRPDAADSVVP